MTRKKITHILLNGTTWATFTYVLVVALAQVPRFAGDTIAMTQSAQALVGCAHSGQFIGCPGTNQYGLLQNIPAIFMIWKGMTLESTITVLGLLNVIAFVVLIVLLWRNFSYGVRHLAILIVLAGPLVGYVSTTFGEFAKVLFDSQRVIPRVALESGFRFLYPDLAGALADDDEPDHDEAASLAAELHELLRPFV